ncbi:MAG: ABC transporter permease [Rhodobacteraceae bacterium]|jgi:putative spermidine/putrescine transport system permease protein|uniref:Putative spermidine/putrescine transport system permease protein n=1 Tax=Salipiger profundus TaxID=1229727 RepID=A0A1U7D955_9RHOB|nr:MULTISPECIES: ABC transporter permease [Salipiger]APX24669.1 putative spermidine/putrescine transport system permease protein [Salipiger profundus]MAB06443.1 ABC transporter permease [Paracoccaceae bacterium]GFZ96952.1 polyamine ABC transporter permease [Salipiger profundus]SFB79612.1 putative spermidine/putrescine transport system permease protein [Salipiger profundus]
MNRLHPGLAAKLLASLVALFLLMPLIAVVPVSFTSRRYLSLPDGEWSWRHYISLFEDPDWGNSLLTSIQVGVLASLLAVLLAAAFCIGLWMLRPRFAGLMTGFVLLPMVAPPVVSSLTLYFFLNQLSQWNGLVAYDRLGGVVLAHMVMIVPYAVVVIMVSLSQLDRRMDLAAQSMGASVATRVFGVVLPNIRFGLIGAFFLCFLLSWDEIGVTLFVTSVETITLPRRMWMGLRDNVDPSIAALSVVLICVVTLVIVGRAALQFRKARQSG